MSSNLSSKVSDSSTATARNMSFFDDDADDEKLIYVATSEIAASPRGNYVPYRPGKIDHGTDEKIADHYQAVVAQKKSVADCAHPEIPRIAKEGGGKSRPVFETCQAMALKSMEENPL